MRQGRVAVERQCVMDGPGLMAGVTNSESRRRADVHALSPLLFDVAVPVGMYYLLHGLGLGLTPAMIVSGLIPFGRSLFALVVSKKADHLALMMVGLFLLSLVLVAFTGSPRFILVKESFGAALIAIWCLGTAWSTRPLTFYTARPFLTKGRPEALESWDRMTGYSSEFQCIQRRLAIVWGLGILLEAGVRVWIAVRLPVQTAVWLVNVPAVCIIVALSLMSGPLGGLRLQRLLAWDIASGLLLEDSARRHASPDGTDLADDRADQWSARMRGHQSNQERSRERASEQCS
jgi:hypothetical protein